MFKIKDQIKMLKFWSLNLRLMSDICIFLVQCKSMPMKPKSAYTCRLLILFMIRADHHETMRDLGWSKRNFFPWQSDTPTQLSANSSAENKKDHQPISSLRKNILTTPQLVDKNVVNTLHSLSTVSTIMILIVLGETSFIHWSNNYSVH